MNKIRFFDGGMGTMLQAAGLLGPVRCRSR